MNWGEFVIDDSEYKRQLRQVIESTCRIVKLSGEVIKKVAAVDSEMSWKEGSRRRGEKRVKDGMEDQSDRVEGHFYA